MFVTVIIPNFNGKKLLEDNLPSVIREIDAYCKKEKKDAEVIIVDDASSDESVLYLENHKKSLGTNLVTVHYLANTHNVGFARTVNRGVSHAKGKYLLLLNTDVVPEKDFLEPLIHAIEKEHVFAVGCLDKSIEHGKIVERGRGIGRWHEGFLIHSAGKLDKDATLWVSGGSGLFRKDIWNKLKGLNELYSPFYWEDIDLSYRALKSGYNVLFEKRSTVIHEHEKGAIKKERDEKYIKAIAYRNQFLFVWLNITDKSLFITHVLWLPIHVIRSVKNNDKAFLSGFFMAISKINQVIKKRKELMKSFIKKDREIFPEYSI